MTANTIEGRQPYLKLSDGTPLTNLGELLGFRMWDGTYESDGTTKHKVQVTSATTNVTAPQGMTFNDVTALVTADGASYNVSGATVGYYDGDAAIAGNTSVSGNMKATWYNNGVPVTTNLSDSLTPCDSHYTLKIDTTSVVANTTYGAPNSNNYGTSSKTYTFITAGKGICYAKPNQMVVDPNESWLGMNAAGVGQGWNTTSYTTPHAQNGGGYSSDFVPNKGFKAGASTKFPTTGFPKAKFQLVMTGLQTDWNYSVSATPNGSVTVDAVGNVTLNSKLSGNVTVRGVCFIFCVS